MKILVPTKRVPDTDQKIKVAPTGDRLDLTNIPFVINPFDAIALEEALRIRERGAAAEIVTVGIGTDDYEKELRSGLAMGADRSILVHCAEALDPWNAARILAAVVRRESPGLVLMGKQAVDDDANQTGQFLAALLGWPQATFASRIELLDHQARVARETDQGMETVCVDLPAVITADLRLNEPRYASLPSIMKARGKPIERIACSDLAVTIEPRVRILGFESSATKRTCHRVASVEELIERLRTEAEVI